MVGKKKRVIVSVTNDLTTDQRVHKVCCTLVNMGYEVLLVGRKLVSSVELEKRPYRTLRMKLQVNKGPFFYAIFNLRLFFKLIFTRFDLLVSNDLDTLLANYLVSGLKCKPVVYDSHEFFTEVPELTSRPKVKRVWEAIERAIFPRLKYIYTVNDSIAKLYQKRYNKNLFVVRNIPLKKDINKIGKGRRDLGLPENKKIIILQGAGINIDRGGEELVESMKYLEKYLLLIVGSGDVIETLKEKVKIFELEDRVWFKGKLPYLDMIRFTINSNLGITLDKPTNINYKYSLPNKLFDYIHANIPVLASDLVEVKRIVLKYNVGRVISNFSPINIAKEIEAILENEELLKEFKKNCEIAAGDLSWENEEKVLHLIYDKFL